MILFPIFSSSAYGLTHFKKQAYIKFSLTFLTSPVYFVKLLL